MQKLTAFLLAAAIACAQAPQPALQSIDANSLKGDLSFLASDLLEGRGTPSRGLDLAAEFIASRFRAAGLEPAGDDGYFQTAKMTLQKPGSKPPSFVVHQGEKTIAISPEKIVARNDAAVELSGAPVVKVDLDFVDLAKLKGKVVAAKLAGNFRAIRNLQRSGASLVVLAGRMPRIGAPTRLVDPNAQRLAPLVFVDDESVLLSSITADITLPPPDETPVKLRNVVGVLRGSDPALRDTYVIVSAHYDHLGMNPGGSGDTIYNGANDDASGTASVLAAARAIAALPKRPKRSIVFLAVFGEELGLIGSHYYAAHPVFPLDKTVAVLNLEQTGRTDESEKPVLKRLRVTGDDFSDVLKFLDQAGRMTGIKIEHEPKRSAEYFGRSDNLSFAEKGIPAHTIVVAYTYPDYHGLGDSWEKIDYENMAAVTRTIAEGAFLIADSTEAPHWNPGNPAAAKFATQAP